MNTQMKQALSQAEFADDGDHDEYDDDEFEDRQRVWEDDYDDTGADEHEREAWERTRACALVWDYHPNLDENSACKMYAEFEAFSAAGHSFVDAMAFAGICPSDNPFVNYVRRFVPHCSEQDAIEKYRIYRSYRDEGQNESISRQYAGLL